MREETAVSTGSSDRPHYKRKSNAWETATSAYTYTGRLELQAKAE